ncbi:hypothetical protein Agub_g4806 [Astrephomene gubernaculifera]|uniref:SecA Wing/Scaffold domain-containing protein n=1 Tax=Astrephomene gubernaculifera TaxID=47775 RepID=A0AAD3DPS7_9CHLO|nr:hypothetical protein Agub_g4806 [Astrephomene gubernaculifera]
MCQYCYLLEGLTGSQLASVASSGGFEGLRTHLHTLCTQAYESKVAAVEAAQPGLMAEVQRFFLLSQTDALWKEHLQAIKFLQQAVGLRGYASKDPLTEFKLEGFNLFVDMTAQIRRNVIYNVYMFQPQRLVPVQEGAEGAAGGDKGQDKEAGAAAREKAGARA